MSGDNGSGRQMHQVFDEAYSLFMQKNADYGDSWRNHGWRGNLGRILEKSDRLQTTLWHGRSVAFSVPDESARQTAIDMINTLAFFVINWDARKEWGWEPNTEYKVNDSPVIAHDQSSVVTLTAEEVRATMTPSPGPRPVRDHSVDEPFDE
jgi:hypothetical protein